MKSIKVALLTAASALLLAAPAMAFHDGGVAACERCHTMHNSLNNTIMGGGTQYQSGPYLLQGGGEASDSCLNCHSGATLSSYHVDTPTVGYGATAASYPANRGPGGDFSWLKVATGTQANKDSRGHNIMGTGHGYAADSRLVTSPGGSYPAANLQCSSCHDPHGKYRVLSDGTVVQAQPGVVVPPIAASGSYNTSPASTSVAAVGVYRILAGKGYLPKSMSTQAGLAFANDAPIAVAPSTYNRSESATMTRVAYGKGMSEYCGNCHAAMLNAAGTVSSGAADGTHVHPAGNSAKLGGGWSDTTNFTTTIANNYNTYKKTGDMSNTVATSFDSLVPFEEGTSDLATLKAHAKNDDTFLTGPDASNSNVMCLSCHRAHASGFSSMIRYQIDNGFVNNTDSSGTVNGWNADTSVNAMNLAAYYDKPATKYGAFQRPLCNKCHAKD
jgi:hypothetical protein